MGFSGVRDMIWGQGGDIYEGGMGDNRKYDFVHSPAIWCAS